MKVVMVTGNKHKFLEAEAIARPLGLELVHRDLEVKEVRGTLEEIVEDKARKAYKRVGEPVICDDSGLFIDALNGFPGEFSAFTLERIGVYGTLKLMEGIQDRAAEFRCAACYYDGGKPLVKLGVVRGELSWKSRGAGGFGYDPIFIPEGHMRTFSEDFDYKMEVSHRRRAFEELFAGISKKPREEED